MLRRLARVRDHRALGQLFVCRSCTTIRRSRTPRRTRPELEERPPFAALIRWRHKMPHVKRLHLETAIYRPLGDFGDRFREALESVVAR